MRILFISDIHGITTNLNVLNKRQFDKLVVLGDLYSPRFDDQNNDEVRHILEQYQDKIIYLRGNCDSETDIKRLSLPVCDMTLLSIDDIDIYCHHGHKYSYSKSQNFYKKGILIYGHEHHPYIKQEDDMTYICVGSISIPRYNSDPSYCWYEDRLFTIYNVDGEELASVKI